MGAAAAVPVTALPTGVPSSVADKDSFLAGWRRGLAHNQARPLRLETLDEIAMLLHMARVTKP
jgi:hypothetical protein